MHKNPMMTQFGKQFAMIPVAGRISTSNARLAAAAADIA
jgi:hypothetical protein